MAKQKILLVDDEPDLRWTFEMRFEDGGYDLATVSSGEEAIPKVKETDFPVVILDSKLPGMDGFDLAKSIKKQRPNTKIIFFSGFFGREDTEIQKGLKSGLFDDFLPKPFDFEKVEGILDKYCLQSN